VRFAIDTGATRTTLSEALLEAIGYVPSNAQKRSQVTTVSGVEQVPELEIDRLEVLGHRRVGFPIFCLTPPDEAGIDGLLGLDFLRGLRLTLDFNTGLLALD
jgi:predicted aspartyl protease